MSILMPHYIQLPKWEIIDRRWEQAPNICMPVSGPWIKFFVKSISRNFKKLFFFFIPLFQIVETLLTNGAHIDSRNGRGQRPLDMLKHIPDCKINPLMYLTLRCLAASVIAQNKLPYKREIPTILEEFIESH